jgi:hypothetical protein
MDWTFWTMVVAGLALVLSQLPPIHQLLKRSKLAVEVYSRVLLTQKVGNPNINLHVIFTNLGGRSIRIRGATLTLKRDGKVLAELPAQTYFQNPSDTQSVLFTSFSLKPKEDWAHVVTFLIPFSRAGDKQFRAAELVLKKDINEKGKLPENKERLVEADQKSVQPFTAMFERMFIWQPGEYEVSVTVNSIPKAATPGRSYRFTLFESDSAELAGVKDAFRFGDGIYWDSGNFSGVGIQLVES